MDDSLEKKEEQKKKIKRFLAVMAAGMVVLVIYLLLASRPLDEIQNYEVEATPLPQGAVEITYRYEWTVLNDSRQGPLEWVKLGMANYDYRVVEYGGAITGRHYDASQSFGEGPYLCFDLNRPYYKGETVSFWFTVIQGSLMCNNPENPDQPFYDFTPGWFNHIRVHHYQFLWNNPAPPAAHNADREMGDTLIWEGSLDPGNKRNMNITYRISDFDSPHLVNQTMSYGNNGGDSSINSTVVILIIFLTGYIGFRMAWGDSSYANGRGYGRGYRHYHRGGGGCACACAGCACACACAGGGRAGCSQKDFYGAIQIPREIPGNHDPS